MNHSPFRKVHYLILFFLLAAAILFSFREALGQRRGGGPSYGYPSYGYPSYGYYSAPAQSAPAPSAPAPSYGYPSYGYPSYGYPSYGYPSYGYYSAPAQSAPAPVRQEAPPAQREAPRPQPQPQAPVEGGKMTSEQTRERTQRGNEARQALENIQNQAVRRELEGLISQSIQRGTHQESIGKLADILNEIAIQELHENLQPIKQAIQQAIQEASLPPAFADAVANLRTRIDREGASQELQDQADALLDRADQFQLQQSIEEHGGNFQDRLKKLNELIKRLKKKQNLCTLQPNLPQCKKCIPEELDAQECTLTQQQFGYTCPGIQTRTCDASGSWGAWGSCSYEGADCTPFGERK